MDPLQDDSAPAGSSDTGGTPYRAAHDETRSERDSAAAADPMAAARATTVIPYRVTAETARMLQDVVFRVGPRLGNIKCEELDNASTAVKGNVLRFIRTFEQYIEEIRPDSPKEEVIELLREFFSDTKNFVHRQVLQISSLHILLRGGSVFIQGGREASRRRLYTFASHQSACARQGRVRNSC
jgi:hypothetical protein